MDKTDSSGSSFSVFDNLLEGCQIIGFDMKYYQKIFVIFQRLHKAEEFQGTGIGLAMVNKAMQKMGGKAWAESIPGIGSTFYLEMYKTK